MAVIDGITNRLGAEVFGVSRTHRRSPYGFGSGYQKNGGKLPFRP